MIRNPRLAQLAKQVNQTEQRPPLSRGWSATLISSLFLMPLLAIGKGAQTQPATAPGDWPMVGRDLGQQRYSPLTQITPANVASLKVAWTYHMKPANVSALHQSETQPLVIGTTMYVVTPYSRVVALDSATGQEKWAFNIPDGDNASLRGASYWAGEGAAPAIIFGTRRGRMYSISAATGQLNPGFGVNGMVDLKTPEVMTTGMDKSYILPSPPVIYKDLVITGSGPGEGPGGKDGGLGPAGDTRAWDAKTGKLVWTFHSVPRPGETGHDTWSGDSWKDRSGVNVWGYMTVDMARGILYMPFGAPNNDRVGVDRPGNNLFGSTLVAVSADTGKLLWYFQVVHHDIWDMDTQSPPTLFDVQHDGKTIPAVATVNKNGLMFILDRVTGKPIYGVEERPVPKSNVPGEETSPTQPFPVLPEPLSQTTISRATLYNDTPDHAAWCKKYVDDNNMLLGEVEFTPPQLDRYTVTMPGTQGGVNFYGGAFDPKLGLFIANVNNLSQPMRIVRNPDGSYNNSGPLAGLTRFWNPDTHLPCTPTPWGQLVAVNVNTGKIAWRSTLGVTDSFPEGKQKTGRPGLGGAILTASGLTFVGATDDARFRAFETATGKEIWTAKLPASAESTPITYADSTGRQYIAIVATGGGLIGAKLESDALVVYSLEGPTAASSTPSKVAPPTQAAQTAASAPATSALPKGMPAADAALFPPGPGRELMLRTCSGCHAAKVSANKRMDPKEWNDLVQVMAGRGAVATDEEFDAVAAYLAHAFPRTAPPPDPAAH
ncbi:PQQ-binding-like beta-propeller repeat protein [Granulicella sibirica]|uniref:Glucose dehydrogenase, PQQ-dependent n=1 Tax=Granulicella sibirica TaxID=2479048 RepID=A0A4Q0SZI6_9BACT|nr:PQQ-binding-like beta-propeller repeat protein [Granulicella sibirica]RXH54641.1 Glucose dehydrogenase, PQQ-dependent [Granulicella sibirica]